MSKTENVNVNILLIKNKELTDVKSLIKDFNKRNVIINDEKILIYKIKNGLKTPDWILKLNKALNIDISSNMSKALTL